MEDEDKTWAITSLATGIGSIILFLMPYFSVPLAILAIAANTVQKRKSGPNGMSTAGLVCGIIGLILGIPMLIVFFIVLAMGGIF